VLIPDINSIHEIVPNLFISGFSNRQLPESEKIYFETRGVSMPDKETLDREFGLFGATHNLEERAKEKVRLDYALARKKFVALHNYYIPTPNGPRAVTDFDDFCRVAPPELVAWYFDVIQWGEKLSMADRKNFLPPPVSPSGSQSGETETSGNAETATTNSEQTATATT
jgi:hypothetical protein